MSAIKTFVLPRGEPTRLSRFVFVNLRHLRMRFQHDYYERDHFFALYAPVGLLLLPLAWLVSVWVGFAVIFWGLDTSSWWLALKESGSSLLTLGNAPVAGVGRTVAGY